MKYIKKIRNLLLIIVVSLGSSGVYAEVFGDEDDIPEWAHEAIMALYQAEIITGNDDGTIRPFETINRAEFSKVVVTATEKDLVHAPFSNFLDVETTDWFSPYIEAAFRQNWVSGYPDGTFRPGKPINRAEVAKILCNAFLLDIPQIHSDEEIPWFRPYFEALDRKDLLPYGVTIDDLDPETYPTRAEVFDQIYRLMLEKGTISKLDLQKNTETEPKNDNADYVEGSVPSPSYGDVPTAQNPGKLYLSSDRLEKTTVGRGQGGVKAHNLTLSVKSNPVTVHAMTFRRVGNGTFRDFKNLVLKNGTAEISAQVTPVEDVFTIHFSAPLTIYPDQQVTLGLYTDIAKTAQTQTSSRFVLFLPDWISDDSESKIGFFPFGGRDIVIE
jgi:hypothetical protein